MITIDVDMATNLNRGIDPQGKESMELLLSAKKRGKKDLREPGDWCHLVEG